MLDEINRFFLDRLYSVVGDLADRGGCATTLNFEETEGAVAQILVPRKRG